MAAQIQVLPSPVAFGSRRTGSTTQPQTVVIKNIGDTELDISAFVVTGPYAVTGFSLPAALGPGAFFSIYVTFSPTATGAQNGTLTITSNDGGSPTAITLTGTGVTGANLDQVRAVEFVDGSISRYDVTSTMTVAGPLPHLYVFVMQVTNRSNAKADVFQRVARVADMTTLPQGRDAGLAANSLGVGFSYLSITVFLAYPDLATALAGTTAIQDRVNYLITQWVAYTDIFAANPQHVALPITDLLAKNALIATYSVAKQNSAALGTARDAAKTTLDAANSTLTSLAAQVAQVQKFYQDLTTLDGAVTRTAEMQAAATAFQTLRTACNPALAAIAPGATYDTFQAAMVAADVSIATANQGVTNHTTFQGIIDTYLGTLQTAKTTATAAVATATTTYTGALQAFNDSTTAETTALNAVLAVAPDFDPTTVCAC